MDNITWFHDFLLCHHHRDHRLRAGAAAHRDGPFQRERQPVPSRTTHNTLLEVAWTIVPIVILLVDRGSVVPAPVPAAQPAGGRPDGEGDRQAVELGLQLSRQRQVRVQLARWSSANELKPDQPRLLAVDNELVVPVNKIVRVLVTGADVIHAFAVPSFGIKIDAIPGRHQRDLVQGRRAKASTTASARSCAARTMPSCRSPSAW